MPGRKRRKQEGKKKEIMTGAQPGEKALCFFIKGKPRGSLGVRENDGAPVVMEKKRKGEMYDTRNRRLKKKKELKRGATDLMGERQKVWGPIPWIECLPGPDYQKSR